MSTAAPDPAGAGSRAIFAAMDPQLLIGLVLAVALGLFVWGYWRYDLVALMTLIACVALGLVPADGAFAGFSHPAVVTVAAVLVLSRALGTAGVVDIMGGWLGRIGERPLVQAALLTLLVAVFSAFMNNVGALALLLPVAIRIARDGGFPASRLLMPLAFGSLLGGMTTLIGTPPNIIIASYRETSLDQAFGMFDFAPVGVAVMAAGLVLLMVLPRFVLPDRRGEAAPDDLFDIGGYLLELRVDEDSDLIGETQRALEPVLAEKLDGMLVGLRRNGQRSLPQHGNQQIREGDVLVVQADPEKVQAAAEGLGLKLDVDEELAVSLEAADDELVTMEAVVLPDGRIAGHDLRSLALPRRFGVVVLAVARQGQRVSQRLSRIRFRGGDVLLLQGDREALSEATSQLGCLPLADRELSLGAPRKLFIGLGLFLFAIAAVVAGLAPVQIALTAAAAGVVLGGVINLRQAYSAIDWPVIILLGAMIPVGQAFEASGAAASLTAVLLEVGTELPPVVILGALLLTAMLLSDLINNASAAVLLAPIAVALAHSLNVSPDPFLMAVAIGASCAFLTPIGHQSNTLVMGPGGYRFSDYARLGLPLQILVFCLGLPMLLLVWPF